LTRRILALTRVFVISFFLSLILLLSINAAEGSLIAEAFMQATENGLSVSENTELGNSQILAVQHTDERLWYTDYALRKLGIPHDTVKVTDFPKINLAEYQIIIVGTVIGTLEETKPYLDSKSAEIEKWVTSGGCLGVFGQYKGAQGLDLNGEYWYNLGSGYYEWMPGKPTFVSVSSERVSIVNSTHPIMANFTDADLSFWHSSADGYFVQPPGEVLAVHENYYTRPVLYAQILGKGKIVATGLDPDFHAFIHNGNGEKGRQKAEELFKAILNWLGEPETASTAPDVSLFTSASSIPIGFQVELNGVLSYSQGLPVGGGVVVLSYIAQGMETWIPITSVVTDSNGFYSAIWFPSATGNFTVKAEYIGNGTYSRTQNVRSLSVHKYTDGGLFFVESNSTVSSIIFNSEANEISFSVSGESGTFGYTKFLISKALVANVSDLKVYVDGTSLEYDVTSKSDSWILHFEYTHSSHEIVVAVPELSNLQPQSSKMFPTVFVATVSVTLAVFGTGLIASFKKRKH
jgi:hypothetical protein